MPRSFGTLLYVNSHFSCWGAGALTSPAAKSSPRSAPTGGSLRDLLEQRATAAERWLLLLSPALLLLLLLLLLLQMSACLRRRLSSLLLETSHHRLPHSLLTLLPLPPLPSPLAPPWPSSPVVLSSTETVPRGGPGPPLAFQSQAWSTPMTAARWWRRSGQTHGPAGSGRLVSWRGRAR